MAAAYGRRFRDPTYTVSVPINAYKYTLYKYETHTLVTDFIQDSRNTNNMRIE